MEKKSKIYSEPQTMPKTSRGTGFKAAKVGATIGARFGPYGIITGGVLGYLAGIVVDEMLDD
ncbi:MULTISPECIES: hypothetical protein [Vibrio]|uniref:hypothetical protein n=1 Tax=Vibrio TaxID=662 RepID=UPI001869D888|nr:MULTISPECIES: hypothetical protein [Vibrio]HBC3898109.1 hypothetical protein [Vibrio parahaemolyticus]MBE4594507.1 hypothetical protein [Vibrio navarrensis]MDW1607663.1 hypothetical protein [Vibrio sp. Vb2977]MDW1670505.1 hypothetical protein [Vibrio sp. Vb2978]MDW1684650.1 hypothetical protein [Vibrio sp. Vb2942]